MTLSYTEFHYTSGRNPNGEYGEKLAGNILQRVKGLQGVKKICELGCGNGYFANDLASLGYEVIGVDLSESGIELAKKNYGDKVSFLHAPVNKETAEKIGRNSFDLVLSINVLAHIYRPSDLIEAAGILMKKEGCLIVTTPYHGYFKNLLLAISGKMDDHFNPLDDQGAIKFFSVKTLSTLIAQHGFTRLHFSFYGRAPWLWKTMICVARKN